MGLRIIGGSLRGKRLHSTRGNLIRPTGNRQREAIFNILTGHVHGASALDLFAGTGALGIEALSRGADHCVFVDNQSAALLIIKRNIRSCGLEDKSAVLRHDISGSRDLLKNNTRKFDLVFMDPPYGRNHVRRALSELKKCGCLKNGATIIVEHAPDEPMPDHLSTYALMDQRRYGKTLVSYLSYVL